MKKFLLPVSALVLMIPVLAHAQEAAAATTDVSASAWGLALAGFGAALATALGCTGSAMGVSAVGQAGAGLLTEKPEMGNKVITLSVLPGSQGLYGMVISLLFFFNFGPIIRGEVPLSIGEGAMLMMAFLPVAITCLTSSPYQGKVCAAGMHMLAKDEKLTGRVITMAALVETYALLGFLISFFMLNAYRGSLLGVA